MQSVAVLLVFGFIASVLAADGKFGPLPKCDCSGLSCECCVGFIFRKDSKSTCLRTNYNMNELTMNADLIMDGNVVTSRTIGPDFIPFCVPAAPPLSICLNARNVILGQNEAKVCAGLNVKTRITGSSVFKAKLPCFTMSNGQFFVSRN